MKNVALAPLLPLSEISTALGSSQQFEGRGKECVLLPPGLSVPLQAPETGACAWQ